MEPEETEAQPAPAPPAHPTPVMDVVPPPAPAPAAETEPEPADEQLHVAPEESDIPENDTSDPASTMQLDEEHEHDLHQQADPQPAAHHQTSSSVTLAIVATIIIVLGLAALATYAFLQTQK